MFIDLARNDLSRNGHTVTVDKYRVQFSPCDSFSLSPDIYMKKSQHHASGRSCWTLSGSKT
jgi:hypothetical protein